MRRAHRNANAPNKKRPDNVLRFRIFTARLSAVFSILSGGFPVRFPTGGKKKARVRLSRATHTLAPTHTDLPTLAVRRRIFFFCTLS